MASALVSSRQPLPRNPRVASAWHPALRAKLEYMDQPLYDSVSFDATSLSAAQVFFFNIGLGGAENNGAALASHIRAGNKSLLNTNLLTPNVLSNPKLFIVTGIGVTWQQFISDVRPDGVNSVGTVHVETNEERDIRVYSYLTWLSFTIGNKSYLNCPLWQVPGEYGVGGSALSSDNDVVAPGRSPVGFQLKGRPYTIDDMQILIPPQQTFGVTFNSDPDTASNISGASTTWTFLGDERAWTVLWGVLGREVQ